MSRLGHLPPESACTARNRSDSRNRPWPSRSLPDRTEPSPAGTADTMEVLANVSFPIKKMKQIVLKTNGCIVWGGSLNLAPADDKIIAVERPLEIDAESQLLASIMAKKHSVSSTHILIDVPVGKYAKVKGRVEALKLQKEFKKIGKKVVYLRSDLDAFLDQGEAAE